MAAIGTVLAACLVLQNVVPASASSGEASTGGTEASLVTLGLEAENAATFHGIGPDMSAFAAHSGETGLEGEGSIADAAEVLQRSIVSGLRGLSRADTDSLMAAGVPGAYALFLSSPEGEQLIADYLTVFEVDTTVSYLSGVIDEVSNRARLTLDDLRLIGPNGPHLAMMAMAGPLEDLFILITSLAGLVTGLITLATCTAGAVLCGVVGLALTVLSTAGSAYALTQLTIKYAPKADPNAIAICDYTATMGNYQSYPVGNGFFTLSADARIANCNRPLYPNSEVYARIQRDNGVSKGYVAHGTGRTCSNRTGCVDNVTASTRINDAGTGTETYLPELTFYDGAGDYFGFVGAGVTYRK